MENAGRELDEAIFEVSNFNSDGENAVLAILGKGRNAGDAIIALTEMLNWANEFHLDLLIYDKIENFEPSVHAWFQVLLENEQVRYLELQSMPDLLENASLWVRDQYHLVLDGLFGMSFRPPLKGLAPDLIQWVNQLDANLRIAVDMPSGLSDQPADFAFKADYTFATGIVKSPIILEQHREWCGRLRYLDIGFFESENPRNQTGWNVINPNIFRFSDKRRQAVSDKRSYGHLLVVAGSRRMPGALLMCVQAAVRSGVGLVSVLCPESLVGYFASQVPEAMWIGWPETEEGDLEMEGLHELNALTGKVTAIAMGPGLGQNPITHALLDEILNLFSVPVLLDADALTRERLEKLITNNRFPVVITPHYGEFYRLAGQQYNNNDEIVDAFVDYCKRPGIIGVLKSSLPRICQGDSHFISTYGGPVLARGGSGDILAGLIGGSLAYSSPENMLEAVCRAVALHGNAADKLSNVSGETFVRTTDLLHYLN